MVTITLYARQQKRQRYIEQIFGLRGRRGGWDDLGKQHWNIYITTCEIDDQSKCNACNRSLKASALWQPRRMGWGGRSERGSGCRTRVCQWLICANVWQKPPQYCKVISLQLKWINWLKNKSNYLSLEPVPCNKRSHCSEKPVCHNKEQPLLASTRESACKATKTQHSQNNKY